MSQVVVVGGGLSGLSAAHTVLQSGGSVVLLDKSAFMGGNSTKATSGINGAGTPAQAAKNIPDSSEIFEEDTVRSGTGVKDRKIPCPPSYPLAKVLTHNSGPAVEWLTNKFGLTLDTVSRLGGHSHPRTHRKGAGGKFPGMMITYALMQELDRIAEEDPSRARVITRAQVTKLIQNDKGAVIGCEYVKDGKTYAENGPVVVATGGYGAGGLMEDSILHKVRPDVTDLPTTNGTHCTGDGITFSLAAGAGAVGLTDVQVHPTGLCHFKDPENRTKFLAAGALRGEGGIILDRYGNRFCNELGTRDYVSGEMWRQRKAPYHLVLNSKASSGIAWHCHHYCGRGVMKHFKTGEEMCKDFNLPIENVKKTFAIYNEAARTGKDPHTKVFFNATPFDLNDSFHVGIVTPVVHYTMGGLHIDENANVLRADNQGPVGGLFAGGEVAGGVHGKNRLGGSALLECVVFGRVSGATAWQYVQKNGGGKIDSRSWSQSGQSEQKAEVQESKGELKTFSLAEVGKHTTDDDCWVVVNGKVLDVTNFLDDHPGGKMAIMTFAGKDATEMFNMVHEEGTLEKYAPETIIGDLAPASKL